MEVRRGSALKDALGLVRISQGDLASPLRIRFIGEEGVDMGCLRREFRSLVVHQLTHSSLVKGR
ncbi:hypothetical protein DPMN_044406 [Dreissena polymorpha]|uniref:HECT domain-containing protein n=1 Tax=Dreissena polymorpha TaxID=45954 RepID=A0A9D4D4J9_DREPO|nr:hypothetical protein DPMN_044406 [Dreissena polymorpha]